MLLISHFISLVSNSAALSSGLRFWEVYSWRSVEKLIEHGAVGVNYAEGVTPLFDKTFSLFYTIGQFSYFTKVSL